MATSSLDKPKPIDRTTARRTPRVLRAAALSLIPAAGVVQFLTTQTERENPPTGTFIDVDGFQLHYVEQGTGQPIVFLHGNGTMAHEFEISGLMGLASRQHRVVALDRPGFGYSERPRTKNWDAKAQADVLHVLLQRLGIDNPIIVAHSWGTLVALALALHYPADVRGLVLLSGYYYPTPRLDVLLLSPPAIPVVGELVRHTVSPFVGRLMWPVLIRKFFSPSDITPAWQARFPVWMTLRPSQILASATETALMVAESARLQARYGELRMPVTIMAGADDKHVSARMHSERLHADISHSRLVMVPRMGHMLHHVVPDQVMAEIDRIADTPLAGPEILKPVGNGTRARRIA